MEPTRGTGRMRPSHTQHARHLQARLVAAGVDCTVQPRIYAGHEVFHFATEENLHSVSAGQAAASWIAERIIQLHNDPVASTANACTVEPPVK